MGRFQPARARLFDHLASHRLEDNVVLSGDIHSAWCADLVANPWDPQSYDPTTGKGVLGVEFISPAVTSPGPAPNAATAAALAAQLRAVSPHLKYIDLFKRGYGVLDLTRERAQGEIYHVETIDEQNDNEQLAAVFVSEAGNQSLVSG